MTTNASRASSPMLQSSEGPPPPGVTSFGAGESVQIRVLPEPPSDEFIAALTEVLRKYPEVEWATISLAARGPAAPMLAVGLRIAETFRDNLAEIARLLKFVGHSYDVGLDVLVLDDPNLVKDARTLGEIFFPWRRKTRH